MNIFFYATYSNQKEFLNTLRKKFKNDKIYTGDDKIDESFLSRNLNKIAPFMEAFFIAFGCMVPIFLNIAMNRDPHNSNNMKA